ncbi:hypothetical protein [Olleya sp. YS]|uniref:hypothetical protein n=1 Tax=Olleya sp. YS TaxID=3028318 RepID=UPI00243425AD|nr:hypothetical protein [Olleya sp. YS]WGD35699.1 hypothetical protein Ollyesu_04635 [Olleya sp. YS]
MKKVLIFFLSLNVIIVNAQEDNQASVNDFNFESTANPAFTIIEESPTAINTPDNLKSLALYVTNGFSEGNIALETNPYWLIPNTKDKSYKDYRGLRTNNKGKYVIDPILKPIQTNSSFSLAYTNKAFEGFEEEKKLIAIGLRTTLLQLYSRKQTDKLVNILSDVGQPYANAALNKYNSVLVFSNLIVTREMADEYVKNKTIPKNYIDTANTVLSQNPEFKSVYTDGKSLATAYFNDISQRIVKFYYNPKNIKPILRLDGAVAYSLLFKENTFSSNSAKRLGGWFTLDLALPFNDKNYFHLYAISRYIDNGFNIDAEQNYFDTNFWDIGGKLELELGKFNLSYEYLQRDGDDEQYRSVGNITYQINKKMSLTGGFGKDFPISDNNLVTIIGINWALTSGESVTSK